MTRTLAQVPPNERGIPWREWHWGELRRIFHEEAERRRAMTPEQVAAAPLNKKRIWTPRDSYGL